MNVHDMDARVVSVFTFIGIIFLVIGLFIFPGPLNDKEKIERFGQLKTIWQLMMIASVIYLIIQIFKGF
jgi:predicted membrane channel-forming protein YqfA (hemolysin III family)